MCSSDLEFMCWTLEDYIMINVLLKGLYEEWSYVELSIIASSREASRRNPMLEACHPFGDIGPMKMCL